MKKLTHGVGLLLAVLILCTNLHCKKDTDEDKSKTELLTSGKWRLTAFTMTPGLDWDGDGDLDTDLYNMFLEECDKDDYYVFNTDGTTETNAGTTKCDDTDPQSETGNWAFTDNENKITIDGETYTIDELTSTRFVVSATNIVQTARMTYSK